MIRTVLIDRRNLAEELPRALEALAKAEFAGLDCETEDSRRHEGLNLYCGYRADGTKSPAKKLVFDFRRTVMCGFSVWPEGSDTAWYVNLNHADVENRVGFDEVRAILDDYKGHWVCHNAPFELTAFGNCLGYELERVICTLQMAVSAYGPDEYDVNQWRMQGLGGIRALLPQMLSAARGWKPGDDYPPELAELVYKVIAKESDSAHSYNGLIADITYGYGLKRAVKTWFGHDMTTFEQVMAGRAHMGQLTGEEVRDYGAEDAYWCLRLFRHLLNYMATNCPEAISAFFEQENPMIYVYSAIWREGVRIDLDAVQQKRHESRVEYAQLLKEMKATVRSLLPFRPELDDDLTSESWYAKNGKSYRERIIAWATSPDEDDPFAECVKVSGPVPNAWAEERGVDLAASRLNISHYMPARVLYYDLIDAKIIRSDGKVQSDGDTRGKLIVRLEKEGKTEGVALLKLMGKLASIEQRMKLYLTPYNLLTDPDTSRIYPVVSSQLATRRMAAQFPNTMQLAKTGDSAYVRGFYRGDADDHLMVSIDWSGIELVIIGELSKDPEFFRAYGQLPHQDLHSGATADLLAIEIPGMTEERFKSFKSQYDDIPERLLTDLDGRSIKPEKVYGYWRRELGKAANFNYWYSGWLATIGERMGWSMEQTRHAVEAYTSRFSVAESWRVEQIRRAGDCGYVILPDGHRRVRPEARLRFLDEWLLKWPKELEAVAMDMGRRIHRRAGNQIVNSLVQGTCATVAKRSILRANAALLKAGFDKRVVRFMWPTHDELTFSARWDVVADAIEIIRPIMCDHPDLFPTLKLDAAPSVGVTFEPYGEKAPFGQIELTEAPDLPCVPKEKIGKLLDTVEVQAVARYLVEEGKSLRLAA